MNAENKKKYLDFVEQELDQFANDFVGNVDFQLNIKGEKIANMNVAMRKSVKLD